MAKILSKSGDSLADIYDVEGSIAGIDELQSKDVNLVHELGGTLFSERLSTRILEMPASSIAQSTAFTINFSFSENTRILALQVVASTSSRIDRVSCAITSGPAVDNTEVPIFAWNIATDTGRAISVLISGGISARDLLVPASAIQVPTLLVGSDSPRPAFTLTMRGNTTAFGAGTVECETLVYAAFPQVAGLSSRGLPIPSW